MAQRFGRYEVIDELGRGAMGVVYRARDTEIGRVVAIKVILTANASPQDIAKYKQRFRREAQAAGRLSHPGIVTIHDIAEDDSGQPYLVMEYIEGQPLNALLGPDTKTPFLQLLDLGIQMAEALDFAHRSGVVHRDIKPQNILVTKGGRAKIADFGIARLEGTELTQEGTSLGTPSFMSPEQFRGGAIDGRTDIFSLGAVLYWMFTGQKPFPGDTVTITSFQVAFENPVPPSLAKAGLPKDLDAILSRCLAKSPEGRYATCGELAAELEAVKAGRRLAAPLGAPPDRTAHFPLPPLKNEPARPGDVGPAGQPRGAAPAAAPGKGQTAPAGKSDLLRPIAAAAVVIVVGLAVAGTWFWWRTRSTPSAPSATTVAQVAAPAATAAAVPVAIPPAAENTSADAASSQTPSGDAVANPPAAENSAPANPPAEASAAPAAPKVKKPKPAAAKPTTSATPAPEAAPPPAPAPVEAKPAPSPAKPAAAEPGPVVLSKLDVECKFPFKRGTLEITVDGKAFLQEKLEEKRNLFTAGIVANKGFEKKEIPIPAGQHTIHVHIEARGGNPVWDGETTGAIGKDAGGKLKIVAKEVSKDNPGKPQLEVSLEAVK